MQVASWLRRRLSLKGWAEVGTVYIFLLILYRLSVLHLPKNHRVGLEQSLFKHTWSVDRSAANVLAMEVWGCQISRDTGLRSLAYLGRSLTKDAVWSLQLRNAFPRLRSNPEAEGRRRPRDEAPFIRECFQAIRNLPRFSDLSRSRKELY